MLMTCMPDSQRQPTSARFALCVLLLLQLGRVLPRHGQEKLRRHPTLAALQQQILDAVEWSPTDVATLLYSHSIFRHGSPELVSRVRTKRWQRRCQQCAHVEMLHQI
jgi:hypothetical protein